MAVVSLDSRPPGGLLGSDSGCTGHTGCIGSLCTHIPVGEPACLDTKSGLVMQDVHSCMGIGRPWLMLHTANHTNAYSNYNLHSNL